ncbi:MAG: hypothetical protein JNM09_08185 [Blastocatellia bacterium]|nr:hypothetical protein [Blastocatellia bacterium]
MFDKYMICEEGLQNVVENGAVTGFQFGARLPYYRGLGLSMVEDIGITVDGETIPHEQVLFSVRGRTWTLEQMETEIEERWEMGEVAMLIVQRNGGLSSGDHKIELMEQLRISYLPFPSITRDTKTLTLAN